MESTLCRVDPGPREVRPFLGRTDTRTLDLRYKVVVLGDFAAGKTSLLTAAVYGERRNRQPVSTVGVDFLFLHFETGVGDRLLQLQLWDTAGQERFGCMTGLWKRRADAILVVVAADDPDPAAALRRWRAAVIADPPEEGPPPPLVQVVVTKADLLGPGGMERFPADAWFVAADDTAAVDLLFSRVALALYAARDGRPAPPPVARAPTGWRLPLAGRCALL